MDEDVNGMRVVGSIETELLDVKKIKGMKSMPYLFSGVKQFRNGHGE